MNDISRALVAALADPKARTKNIRRTGNIASFTQAVVRNLG